MIGKGADGRQSLIPVPKGLLRARGDAAGEGESCSRAAWCNPSWSAFMPEAFQMVDRFLVPEVLTPAVPQLAVLRDAASLSPF